MVCQAVVSGGGASGGGVPGGGECRRWCVRRWCVQAVVRQAVVCQAVVSVRRWCVQAVVCHRQQAFCKARRTTHATEPALQEVTGQSTPATLTRRVPLSWFDRVSSVAESNCACIA